MDNNYKSISMIDGVEVKVPQGLNIKGIVSETDNILQTINAYDMVNIKKNHLNRDGKVNIVLEDNSEDIESGISQIINAFSYYCKIKVENIIIEVNKCHLRLNDDYSNILSGLLMGLNFFYRTNLSIRELIVIGNMVNPMIEYYLVCGCRKITKDGELSSIGNNPFSRYAIIERKDEYSLDEKLRLKSFFDNKKNLRCDFYKNIFFVANVDEALFNISHEVRQELGHAKINIYENASQSKILTKYLK